jgi:arginase family enzyme
MELKVFAAPWGEQQYQQARFLGAPRDWTTNQRGHMEGPMALAAYVAGDGLVAHQREERPLALRVFDMLE